MREVGQRAATALRLICDFVRAGVSTLEIDRFAGDVFRNLDVRSATLGYGDKKNPYPANLCISVNEEIVHGIPSEKHLIKDGDIVSIDLVVERNGFMGDTTRTVKLGTVSSEVQKLLRVTEEALYKGIEQARAGNRVGHISHAIQQCAESSGLGVVRGLVGHGIGRDMHEDPQVPNYGHITDGPFLRPGMTIAIEPMLSLGSTKLSVDRDGWTIRTADGSTSAHFEHTVLITDGDPEILTKEKF